MVDVGCAGILVADTFCGPMDALPRAGALLAVDAMHTSAGGCAANVAIDLMKQGITAGVVGRVGQDAPAQVVLELLRASHVNFDHVSTSPRLPTSQTVILLVKGEDRRYIHVFGANREFAIADIDRAWLETLKVFYLGGLFVLPSILMDELADLLRFCRTRGAITVLDVVIPTQMTNFHGLERVLPYVDYFMPNRDEAAVLTGRSEPLAQARALQAMGANTVVITQGKEGALVLQGDTVWGADAFPVEAIDPSGGGDAFAAGFITGVLRGYDMAETLRYASALGAMATLAIGTTTGVPTSDQAQAYLIAHPLRITQPREGA